MTQKAWYEWDWMKIIEEHNFITFPYEDYWVSEFLYERGIIGTGKTQQEATDDCIEVLLLWLKAEHGWIKKELNGGS